jgi:tetratricopeptide (TPR) repeat protein
MVHIHPYVLIKLRDDPRLRATAYPEDRARLGRMWRASKLAAMPTGEIETHLLLMGVPLDRATFIQEAKTWQSAWMVAEEWGAHLLGLSRADQDFLKLAVCELWRRLCRDSPSLEMIDDWLCEGYALAAQANRAEAPEAWLKVWDSLRPRLTSNVKDLDEANERFFPKMSQCLSNWSQDFRIEALNGSLTDARCGESGLRFMSELLAILPNAEENLNISGDLAMLCFNLRRDAEAEQQCQRLIREHPDRAIGYVSLADGLLRDSFKGAHDPARIQRAIRILEQALAVPVEDAADFDLPSRLAEARRLLSTGTTA